MALCGWAPGVYFNVHASCPKNIKGSLPRKLLQDIGEPTCLQTLHDCNGILLFSYPSAASSFCSIQPQRNLPQWKGSCQISQLRLSHWRPATTTTTTRRCSCRWRQRTSWRVRQSRSPDGRPIRFRQPAGGGAFVNVLDDFCEDADAGLDVVGSLPSMSTLSVYPFNCPSSEI
uniref:Uncharacterized protein n=1 Tax=Schistocephalus solidus TaxID=70667 RepID=A0A0X3NZV3_SCHSO